jgi:hypothetical protein
MSRFKRKDIVHADVDQELYIDLNHLNEELMDQPLLFRKWTGLKAEIERKVKSIKLMLDETKSHLYLQFSNDGTGKKVKEVDAAVTLNDDVKRLERELIDAEETLTKFEGICRAFHQRGEALKDLCANRRREVID